MRHRCYIWLLGCLAILLYAAGPAAACGHGQPATMVAHHQQEAKKDCCKKEVQHHKHVCNDDCKHQGCPCMNACHASAPAMAAHCFYQPLLAPAKVNWHFPQPDLPNVHLAYRVPPKIG